MSAPSLRIAHREIGPGSPPFVIAEIGINHEGSVDKAHRMIDDAADAGAECVKFQCHVIEDEMVAAARGTIPGNTTESIWDVMSRCALDERAERALMAHAHSRGLIYLSTPFSRAAADRLDAMGVPAFKIGSGECNNTPLVRHIASKGKPVLLSTGMNDPSSVAASVNILRAMGVPFAVLHCTSIYPTPYDAVRLGAIAELMEAFPDAVLGFSDHSLGNWCCYAAVALGACVLERHFTSDRSWPGPDISLSMDPAELRELLRGVRAIHESRGGSKTILPGEAVTMAFAHASVVTIQAVKTSATLTLQNTWVKRPGTGGIPAARLDDVLGKRARRDLPAGAQVDWTDLA